MNKVMLIGRLTKDSERAGKGEKSYVQFTLAVNEGKDKTSFIPCVCFGKLGETAEKYLKKGVKIAAEGRLSLKNVKKDDVWKTYVNVVLDSFEFCESKKAEPIEDFADEEIPFN